MKGKYIVIEGADGVGKTTQEQLLVSELRLRGIDAITTREPGGTKVGEQVRHFLLDDEYADERDEITQVLGYNFARAILVRKVIARLLNEGKTVITSRSWLSTVAYQAFAEGVDLGKVKAVCELAMSGHMPDRIFILDVPVEEAARRLRERDEEMNHYDRKPAEFHNKVRDGYRWCASRYSEIVTVVDGNQPKETVFDVILGEVLKLTGEGVTSYVKENLKTIA